MFEMFTVAAEGDAGLISTALSNVSTIFLSAVGMVTEQPIAMAFIGMALVGGGIGLFRKVRRT